MKRDMDLVRAIMLDIEGGTYNFDGKLLTSSEAYSEHGGASVWHHVRLLADAGYVEIKIQTSSGIRVGGLTWAGHDLLNTIRDPEIWSQTKDGASKVGGAGLAFIAEIAKGYAKAKLQSLGVPIP